MLDQEREGGGGLIDKADAQNNKTAQSPADEVGEGGKPVVNGKPHSERRLLTTWIRVNVTKASGSDGLSERISMFSFNDYTIFTVFLVNR